MALNVGSLDSDVDVPEEAELDCADEDEEVSISDQSTSDEPDDDDVGPRRALRTVEPLRRCCLLRRDTG